MFQRRRGLGAAPTRELDFGQGPSQTISPRASCLWLAPQRTQERAEISKYWLWPHVSGCRKGKERVWAREKQGRMNRKNTVTTATEKVDQDAIASPDTPPPVTIVQTPAAAHSPGAPSASAATPQSRLDNSGQGFLKCLPTLFEGCFQSRGKLTGEREDQSNPGVWKAQPAI